MTVTEVWYDILDCQVKNKEVEVADDQLDCYLSRLEVLHSVYFSESLYISKLRNGALDYKYVEEETIKHTDPITFGKMLASL